MMDRATEALHRTSPGQRPRGVGYGVMVIGWILSVVASVGLVLLLASPQAATVPGNPFSRSAEPTIPKFSVAMKTKRASHDDGDHEETGETSASPEIDRALGPLRQALEKPQSSIARINALIALGGVLAKYATKTKTYPSSRMKLVPVAAAMAILSDTEFEKNVPTSIISEMQYVSDGRSYKVIILGSGDCAVVHALRPEMIDPTRSAGNLDCIAYGLWTPTGRDF